MKTRKTFDPDFVLTVDDVKAIFGRDVCFNELFLGLDKSEFLDDSAAHQMLTHLHAREWTAVLPLFNQLARPQRIRVLFGVLGLCELTAPDTTSSRCCHAQIEVVEMVSATSHNFVKNEQYCFRLSGSWQGQGEHKSKFEIRCLDCEAEYEANFNTLKGRRRVARLPHWARKALCYAYPYKELIETLSPREFAAVENSQRVLDIQTL